MPVTVFSQGLDILASVWYDTSSKPRKECGSTGHADKLMKRLLIVDDEANIRLVVKEYAEFEGYEVAEAEDGMQAVELVKTQDFDVIIMDIMMPRLDGFSACKEIKKYKNIPVIMLSARGEEYDKLFGFELGIDDYVVKPFSPKEIGRAHV